MFAGAILTALFAQSTHRAHGVTGSTVSDLRWTFYGLSMLLAVLGVAALRMARLRIVDDTMTYYSIFGRRRINKGQIASVSLEPKVKDGRGWRKVHLVLVSGESVWLNEFSYRQWAPGNADGAGSDGQDVVDTISRWLRDELRLGSWP